MRRAGARFRDRPALRFGARDWTFAALDRGATRVARRLLAAGLQPGDRVVAFGRNSDAYLLLWLGCARAGLVHVPTNFALTAGELDYIVQQSGATAIFAQPALRAVADAAGSTLLRGTLDAGVGEVDILAAALDPAWDDGEEPGEAVREEDLVQLQYTSGTTGMPKGAMMTHRALLTEYASVAIEMEMRRDDRALAALPLYHTAQMHAFTMPQMLLGGWTLLIEAAQPATVLALIEQARITSFFAPPTVWIGLLQHPDCPGRDLSSLRAIYYGASIMPVPVLHELRARLPDARPFNCYGQSEIAPLATVLRPEEHDARPGSVGRAVLNVETRVVDAEMRDIAPGERGEVVHRSPHLCLGYWNMPEETAKAFEGGWFHSGDVATIDAEGYISIVDRTKDLINTGGVLVASREVEEALFTRGRRSGGHRRPRPEMDRGDRRRRRAARRPARRDRGGAAGPCPRRACPLQGAEAHLHRRGLAEEHRRQAAEAGVAAALCRQRKRGAGRRGKVTRLAALAMVGPRKRSGGDG